MSNYESWRISYQSSEAAARSAWQEMIRLHHRVNELEAQLSAIGAESLHKQVAPVELPEPFAYVEHHKAGDNLWFDHPGGKHSALYTEQQVRTLLVAPAKNGKSKS